MSQREVRSSTHMQRTQQQTHVVNVSGPPVTASPVHVTASPIQHYQAAHQQGSTGMIDQRFQSPPSGGQHMQYTSPSMRMPLPSPVATQQNIDLDARFGRIEQLIMQQVAGLKIYIEDTLTEKINELRIYVDEEVARVSSRVDALEQITREMSIDKEKACLFEPETTVVAINLPFQEDEDLDEKVDSMIHRDMALSVPILRTTRLKPAQPRSTRFGDVSKPGLVKIQFRSVDDKVKVLREKKRLSTTHDYKHVYLRSSKHHTERIAEANFKTMLDLLPGDIGKNYLMSGNGRLVKRDPRQFNPTNG